MHNTVKQTNNVHITKIGHSLKQTLMQVLKTCIKQQVLSENPKGIIKIPAAEEIEQAAPRVVAAGAITRVSISRSVAPPEGPAHECKK